MLTTSLLLQTISAEAEFRPASDPKRPQPGDIVRTSHKAVGSVERSDHRDIYILDQGTDSHGRAFLRTVHVSSNEDIPLVVRSVSYPNEAGCYPQFQHAAPAGPYTDPEQQAQWRAGYSDALAHVAQDERFFRLPVEYRDGNAAGMVARVALGLAKPSLKDLADWVVLGHRAGARKRGGETMGRSNRIAA